jgi:hypothetical protein
MQRHFDGVQPRTSAYPEAIVVRIRSSEPKVGLRSMHRCHPAFTRSGVRRRLSSTEPSAQGPGHRTMSRRGDRDGGCQASGGWALTGCNRLSASEAAFASQLGGFPAGSSVARRIASWAVDPSDQSIFPFRRATQNQVHPLPRRSPRISWRTTSTGPRGVSMIAGSERLRTAVPCGMCLESVAGLTASALSGRARRRGHLWSPAAIR